MRRLSTLQLIPGMVLADNVFSYDNQLILAQGTTLTDSLISRLDLYGILTVSVTDAETTSSDSNETTEDMSYAERVKHSPAFQAFREDYEINVDKFRTSINKIVEKNITLDITTLLKHSLDMIATHQGTISILDMLQNMREYDDSTYNHSMNVALICNILASWLRMSQADIELATACGLLHDVGKLLIPHDIITKPSKLSDEEFNMIRKHPVAGYELLLSQNVDEHVRNAALMHHERNDGTGYPLRLKGNQIDKFASIVAIADVYDAMTAARVYRGPLCPFRVIEIFEEEGIQKYNVELMLTFLENVINSYLRNHCRLNDGREGEIIFINKDKLSRPVIKCGNQFINLAENPGLKIECLI